MTTVALSRNRSASVHESVAIRTLRRGSERSGRYCASSGPTSETTAGMMATRNGDLDASVRQRHLAVHHVR